MQGVHTAFYALYVTKERRSSVQAMQFSNGLTDPIGLWLGHLMFDVIWSILLSSIIIIIFATVSNQFHGLGFLVGGFFFTFFCLALLTDFVTVGCSGALWLCWRPLFLLYLVNSPNASRSLRDSRRVSVSHKHRECFISLSLTSI